MQSTPIKSHVATELDRYSEKCDMIQGPILRHQFEQFFEEVKDLSDKEFMMAVNDQYGFILDHMYKQKISGFLNFAKIILILFLLVPVGLYVICNILF